MIECEDLTSASLEAIKNLYHQHGWLAYLQDDAKLARAFDQSLYTLGAYDGEELVGFIRCVGDGEHIVMVQDLVVAETRLRQGIGKTLMQSVYERFPDVRMLMLLTDAMDERANAFYQSIGMTKLEENGCITYMR
ncbi:MAG: GNAT family N-acetyltransferase [Clostridia bacterium]|nr:GNAT family N-acetyltransferase [Clostridia bacterium]